MITKPNMSNMWKRMSGVFEGLALHEAGEDSSAEPLVGSNGLLTLSALEKAKKMNSDRHAHTCHRSEQILVEHWSFEKRGAEQSWVSSLEEFEQAFLPTTSDVPFCRETVDKSFVSHSLMELESPTPGVTLGVHSATPESSSNKNFFSYARPKQKRAARGEWFHSYGVNADILDLIRRTLDVQEHHIFLTSQEHDEGSQTEFVSGNAPENDYVIVVAHELKLESAAQRRKKIEDAKNEHMKVSSRQNYMSRKQASRRGSRNSSSDSISRLASSEHVSPKAQAEFLWQAPTVYSGGSRVAPEQVGNGEGRGGAGAGAAHKYAHSQHDQEAEEAGQIEGEEPDSEFLALEEYQVVMFLFPERNLLISFGDLDIHGPVVEACRDVLQNRKSAVVSDLLDETPGCGNGAATLLVAMLDATMDLAFPIMAKFSDALEGLQVMASEYCSEFHVATSNQIKMQMTQVRRFVWDSRALFMELSQDMSGALGPLSRKRAHVLLESTAQLEKEAEANMQQCRHVEAIYAGVQDTKMNSALFFLTRLSMLCIPVQTISGWYGMNFEMADGTLALDGSECSRLLTPLWDPCRWLMPELSYRNSYIVVSCIALSWIFTLALYIIYTNWKDSQNPFARLEKNRKVK